MAWNLLGLNGNGTDSYGHGQIPVFNTSLSRYTPGNTAAGGLTNINISAGTTSNNLSNLVFSNSNGLAFGLDGSTITGSYTVPSVAGLLSNIRVSAGTTSNLLSALTFANANNVSFGIDASTITASASFAQSNQTLGLFLSSNTTDAASSGTQDARSLTFRGMGIASLGYSAGEIIVSVPAGGGGLTAINLSAGTTSNDLSAFVLSNSNNVSFGLDGSTITASATVATSLTNVRVSAGTTSNLLSALTFANSNGISFGLDGSTLTATVATNYLTTAMASNRGSDFVQATAAFAGTSASGTIASDGISVSIGPYLTTAALSQDSSKYAGTNGAITGGSITVDTSGVSVNLPAYLSTQSTQFLALTLGGNTAGTTTFHASNNASIFLHGGDNITLSGSGSSVTVVGPAAGGVTISEWAPHGGLYPNLVTNAILGNSTLYFLPFDVPAYFSASRINFFVSITATWSGANTRSARLGLGYALYTRGSGVSSERLMLSTSYSADYVRIAGNSSTQITATLYAGLSNATSHTTVGTGISNVSVPTFLSNSLLGFRAIPMPLGLTLSPGRYWLGVSHQTQSSNGSAVLAASFLNQTFTNFIAYRPVMTSSAASNASFWPALIGAGTYSAASAAWPSEIPLTSDSIRVAASVTYPFFNLSGIGTALNIL